MVRCLNPGRGRKFLSFPKRPDRPLGPITLSVQRLHSFRHPGIKPPGREGGYPPSSIAGVKNEWSSTCADIMGSTGTSYL